MVGSVDVAGVLGVSSWYENDGSIGRRDGRPARSRRTLCSGCKRVYVIQKDGERARCIICKRKVDIDE